VSNSLTAKTTGIILVVAAVIVYIGTLTLNMSAERLANSYLASKQFQLVTLLDQVVLELTRADAIEHEFMLTGDPHALAEYRGYYKHIDEAVARLRELLSDNTRYSMLLDELTDSISFRRSCAEEVLQLRASEGFAAAEARSKKFDEIRLTNHVEWLARDVSRTINLEMTNRFSELDKASLNTMAGISFILVSALLALILVILGINRYVSERQRAEKTLREAQAAISEREARMRALVETAPDGILTVRTNGKIETVNAVVEKLFGRAAADMVGCEVDQFIPGFLIESAHTELKRGERRNFGSTREVVGLLADGTKVPLEVSLSVVNLGTQEVYTGIVRDITERKEVEERVKDFYSMVSHELRTPLASIRTALGLLESFDNELEARTMSVVKIAANEADRLMRLINDILDMRKVEAGKLELAIDVHDAANLVSKAVFGITGLAAESKVIVAQHTERGVEVLCDADRILQVLSNILANALKFSPKGGIVTISTELSGSTCKFSVQDQGPGVAKNQAHKLFGRFEQLRSLDGKARAGSGLGLAIAKAIVEQHGGQIGVDLPDEGGSVFWFSLPVAEDEIEPLDDVDDQVVNQDKDDKDDKDLKDYRDDKENKADQENKADKKSDSAVAESHESDGLNEAAVHAAEISSAESDREAASAGSPAQLDNTAQGRADKKPDRGKKKR
jgi:PAS domain S-box-containing protein